MAKDLKINDRSFHQFSIILRGKLIYNSKGEPIPKYILFHKGVNPHKILDRESRNYIIKNRKE